MRIRGARWACAAGVLLVLAACEAADDPETGASQGADGDTDDAGGDAATGGPASRAKSPGVAVELERDTSGFEASFDTDPACFGIEGVVLDPAEVECGTVDVPLEYGESSGEVIQVAVAVIAGSDADSHDRPLMLLGGGPGEVMIEPALTTPGFRRIFDVGPDLIVVDQRGVGASRPSLGCPQVSGSEVEAATGDVDELLDALRACRDELAGSGVDLDAFNHLANAHDIALVRRALGHERIDIRGGSYGSQLALLAAETDPDGVHSLILSSPVDPTRNWVDGAAGGFEAAIDRVADACAADDACDSAFGDLHASIAATVERLDERPQEVTVQLPGGERDTLTFDPATYLNAIFVLFYVPDGPAVLPAMIDAGAHGRLQPLARIVTLLEDQLEGAISTGMQFSMVCSGEGAHATDDAALDAVESRVLVEHWFAEGLIGGGAMERACDVWDVEEVYDPAEVELSGDAPALIVTGTFDHVTPPEMGAAVARAHRTAHLVEVPTAGHGPLEGLGACGIELVATFLADPGTRPDDSCAVGHDVRFLTQVPLGF